METPISVVLKELAKVILKLVAVLVVGIIFLFLLPGLIPRWIVGILGTIVIGVIIYFDKREFHWIYVVLAVLWVVVFWIALYNLDKTL